MNSLCIVCQKTFEYKPIKTGGTLNLSALRPTVCSNECHEVYQQIEAQKARVEAFRRILKVVPDCYQGVKLSDFADMKLEHAMTGQSITASDLLSRYLKNPYWNLTLGSTNYGTGKTRLGLFALAVAASKGIYRTSEIHTIQDAGYYSALSITKTLRTESFDSKQFHMKLFCGSRILMIDDLGQENERDSGEIAGILKVREENNRKTIITTNLDEDGLKERYSGRIASRLARGVFQVIGEDWRQNDKK